MTTIGRRRLLVSVLVAASVLVGSCTAVPTAPTPFLPGEPTPGQAALPRPRVTRGCANGAAPRVPGTTTQTMTVDGIVRTFLLTVPDSGDGPRPLVFDFHGAGSNGQQQWFYSRLAQKGQARGYVTITPTANGPIWAIPPSPVDLHFVDALLNWIGDTACIDRSRIYAAGLSNGSSMTGGLGCHRRNVFAAIGMVAGPNLYPSCTEAEPMPLIAFHGTADTIVPFAGGLALGAYPIRPVTEVVQEIAEDRNHCTGMPVFTFLSPDVVRGLRGGCAMQGDTVLYQINGGGHTWPGAIFDVPTLGPVTRTIDASDLMLDFFDAHTR